MALRENYETKLHIAVVQFLNGQIRSGKNMIKVQKPFPDALFMHPNNEFKDKTEAFWASAKGILPGAADLLFWWQPKREENNTHISNFLPCFGAVELKTENGYLSANQKDFSIKFQAIGGKYAVCRTVKDVRDTLKSWGLQCCNEQVIEPAPSLQAQQANYYEVMKSLGNRKQFDEPQNS